MPEAQCLETIPRDRSLGSGYLLPGINEAIAKILETQRGQGILWLPVIFGSGIGAYFSLPFEPPLFMALTGFLMVVAIQVVALKKDQTHLQISFAVLTACSVFMAGFVCAKIRTINAYTPILEKKIGYTDVTGKIESLESLPNNQGSRMILSDLQISKLAPDKTPKRIRIQIRKDENLWVGQIIKTGAQLNPPSDALIPGGYDFRRAMYFQGIGAVGFAFKAPEVIKGEGSMPGLELLRQKIASIIQSALPGPEGAVVTALTIGQKKGISEEIEQAFRSSGLAHLLAISGLHVGLVAGSVFFVIRFLMALFPSMALRYPIKKIAAAFAFMAALFFMSIAGATIPTQRAVLMISIVLLAVIMDREAISLRLLCVAAFIVLALSPENLLSASFQMSFAAVAALIAVYEATRNLWVRTYANAGYLKRAALYFLGISFSSLIASLATAPISAYHFEQIALYGVIANLAAMPLMAFVIMPAAVLAFVLMPFGLSSYPLQLMGWGVRLVVDTAQATAALPGAVIYTPAWPFLSFVLIIFAGIMGILWRGRGKLAAIPLILIAMLLIIKNPMPDILVSAEGKLVAVKSDNGMLYVNTKRAEKFTRENWEHTFGLKEGKSQTFPKESKAEDYQNQENLPLCDIQACRLNIKGQKISILRQPYAQKEECRWADILISFEPVKKKNCQSHVIIDKFDQWRYGAHAIMLDDGRIPKIMKARNNKNTPRPWSIDRRTRLEGHAS